MLVQEMVAATKQDILVVAIASGVILLILVNIQGPISGSQYNPSITVPLMIFGRIPLWHGVYFLFAQFAGALLAPLIVYYGADITSFDILVPVGSGSDIAVYFAEFFGSLLLTLFIFRTVFILPGNGEFSQYGRLIGGSLTLNMIVWGPVSGACFNPWRYIPPVLFSSLWSPLALAFIILPPLAGIISFASVSAFQKAHGLVHVIPEDQEMLL